MRQLYFVYIREGETNLYDTMDVPRLTNNNKHLMQHPSLAYNIQNKFKIPLKFLILNV